MRKLGMRAPCPRVASATRARRCPRGHGAQEERAPIYHSCREAHAAVAAAANRTLEDRIRAIEDRLEIYDLIASHPPSADTGGRDHIAASWVEDGCSTAARTFEPARTRTIADHVLSPEHQAAIARGLAHFTGLPHVAIDGDTAIVTSYLQILVPQTEGDPVTCPTTAARGASGSIA